MLESGLQPAPIPAETRARKLSSLHVKALDGVRGIAVLMVIIYHMEYLAPRSSLWERALIAPLRIGWAGVDLFFVLSGFLITGILLDTRRSPNYFKSFYARRALRIFPLYYVVLSAILILSHFTGALDYVLPIPHDRIFYFFYLNNWWPLLRDTWHGNILGHFWSLAVEEQFYLLWSVCVFFLSQRRIKLAAVLGIAGALVIRCLLFAHEGVTRNIVENTFSRMDTLLVGAFLASAVRDPEFLKRAKPLIYTIGAGSAAGALLIFYGVRSEAATDIVGLSLLAFAFGAFVLRAFVTDDRPRQSLQLLLCSNQLTTLGKYSYGMYVYHVPLLHAMRSLARRAGVLPEKNIWLTLLFMFAVVTATFVIAKFSFDLFESRFLQLKQYFRA